MCAMGLAIGFYFSWQISLVLLGSSPFLIFSSTAQMKIMMGFNNEVRDYVVVQSLLGFAAIAIRLKNENSD